MYMTNTEPQPEIGEDVSNGELARMIAAGFSDMGKRIEIVEEKVGIVKSVVDLVLTEVDGLG